MVITHAGNICGTLLVCTVLLPWGNKSSRGNSSYKKKNQGVALFYNTVDEKIQKSLTHVICDKLQLTKLRKRKKVEKNGLLTEFSYNMNYFLFFSL